jgi:hypothetical protein
MSEHFPARTSDGRQAWYWAIGVALVAAVPRLLRAWESREEIILRSTPDDAYYYFGIARNIIDGHGASFDGENVTNGFHPLWLAIITPFWILDGDTPIHLALTAGAIFGASTVAIIFLWLLRATDSYAASLFGAAFFAFHPAAVTDSVNGLESALSVMLLALVALALLQMEFARDARSALAHDVLFGLLCGLTMLARTDSVFIIAAVLLFIAIRCGRSAILRPVVMGLAAFVTVVPWLVWSYVATGSIVQISGRAGGVLLRLGFDGDGGGSKFKHGADLTWTMLTNEMPRSYFTPNALPPGAALAGGLALVAFVGWVAWRARGRFGGATLVLGLLVAANLAALSYHSGFRFFTRTWYFTPLALFGALALGLTIEAVRREVAARLAETGWLRPQDALAGLYVAITALLLAAYQPYEAMGYSGDQPHELNAYLGGRWLAENTPPDARAGSFNAGIIGYFSERTVVNLDGVVNEDGYEALKSCNVTSYVRDQRLDYLVDFVGVELVGSCGPPVVAYTQIIAVGRKDVVHGQVEVLSVTPLDE